MMSASDGVLRLFKEWAEQEIKLNERLGARCSDTDRKRAIDKLACYEELIAARKELAELRAKAEVPDFSAAITAVIESSYYGEDVPRTWTMRCVANKPIRTGTKLYTAPPAQAVSVPAGSLIVPASWAYEHSYPVDWACSRCRPNSDVLIDGFVCVHHRAEDVLVVPQSEKKS